MPDTPQRPVYCVDWDGVCVEESWPEMGDWLPGAIDGLTKLAEKGKTVVFSARCNRLEYDGVTPRPPGASLLEEARIRAMLTEAGLPDVEVYPAGLGKPPAKYYIDDRAVRHHSWGWTLMTIFAHEAEQNIAARSTTTRTT
jgi:hypothetical protein